MKKYVLCLISSGLLLLACSEKQPAQAPTPVLAKIREKSKENILVCAHRAYHRHAPENSMAALQASADLGVDIVEIDIRTTADDSLILMHDATVNRTTNGSGEVSQLSYSQISDLLLLFNDSLTQQGVPTLTKVLNFAKGKDIILNLDLKAVDYDHLYKKLIHHGMQYQVISFIGSDRDVVTMKGIDSLYAILPLARTIDQLKHYNELVVSPLIHLVEESFNQAVLQQAAGNGQITFINSLKSIDQQFLDGDIKSMNELVNLKPGIIQTDYPAMLIDYLKQKKIRK